MPLPRRRVARTARFNRRAKRERRMISPVWKRVLLPARALRSAAFPEKSSSSDIFLSHFQTPNGPQLFETHTMSPSSVALDSGAPVAAAAFRGSARSGESSSARDPERASCGGRSTSCPGDRCSGNRRPRSSTASEGIAVGLERVAHFERGSLAAAFGVA